MRIRMEGFGTLTKEFEQLHGTVQVVAEALYDEGRDIMAESQRRVPIKTGLLLSSGHVHMPKQVSLNETVVELTYGVVPNVHYATIVHETHRTRSKFLENPAKEAAAGYENRIISRIKRKMT